MLKRPAITYAGDQALFSSLRSGFESSLPQESVEWRRSFGRPTKSVHIEVDFVPFSEEVVVKDLTKGFLGHSIFHTFWTDCLDIETYKARVREALQAWLLTLKRQNAQDWMVILVETPDAKKANKLIPRTTVLDKIKSDFGGKQSERCVSLIDPTKSDSRSVESWQLILSKMRHLLMIAYNRSMNKFEEVIRTERERRIEKNWSFCKYFLLQEEMAHILSLLSLHDEALIQYDELDALFTQFILNSAAGEVPFWLSNFSQPCQKWEGLFLSHKVSTELQEKVRNKSITILEFRNYLFQCQAALLMKRNKPWEAISSILSKWVIVPLKVAKLFSVAVPTSAQMELPWMSNVHWIDDLALHALLECTVDAVPKLAARALSFLQNTVGELRILDVNIVDGGVACWGFLSCLEVLRFLSEEKNLSTMDTHAVHTAPLWVFARDKLKELGNLCGLMPGCTSNNENLHLVVTLICGMGEDPHIQEEAPEKDVTPLTRLKEALSSPEAFQRNFLDLSEVAISTYKHIGRFRSARLIGRDLALFYMKEGSFHQAATFLSDQLKNFLEEGWELLASHTQTELAKCYLAMEDNEKYIKTCIQLAACSFPSYEEVRIKSFGDMMKASEGINDDNPLMLSSERIFDISWLTVISPSRIIFGSEVEISLLIYSRLPTIINFEKVEVQLIQSATEGHVVSRLSKKVDVDRKSSTSSSSSVVSLTHRPPGTSSSSNEATPQLKLSKAIPDSESHPKLVKMMGGLVEDEGVRHRGPVNPFLKKLEMEFELDYKQDKSLSAVSVNCLNANKALRRENSRGGIDHLEQSVTKADFSDSFILNNTVIAPGKNELRLKTLVDKKGSFTGGQITLCTKKFEFICDRLNVMGEPLVLEVITEKPQVFLSRKERDLVAGLCQPIILTIKCGSSVVEEGTSIKLKASRGLLLRVTEVNGGFEREITVKMKRILPFDQTTVDLEAIAEIVPQKDTCAIEHSVSITSTLLEEPRLDIDIHFVPPFLTSHKLHTANLKKFVQVIVSGIMKRPLELSGATLIPVTESDVSLQYLNPPNQKLTICTNQSVSYMWELSVDYSLSAIPPVKVQFNVNYEAENSETGFYKYNFDIKNYKTLYTIRAKVNPAKGTEFCRAGNMCHFTICLQRVGEPPPDVADDKKMKRESGEYVATSTSEVSQQPLNSVMYEVITDPAMWAVCGRTSGVLSLDDEEPKQNVILEVMPLIGGFLPLPSVRLSKYIPPETKTSPKDGKKCDIVGTASSVPRLEPFSAGQVYSFSKAMQVHVLPTSNTQADGAM